MIQSEYIEVREKPIRRATTGAGAQAGRLNATNRALAMVRLNRWGSWVARNSDSGVGYPRHTVLARMAPRYQNQDPREIYFDDDELATDAVVRALDEKTRTFLLTHFTKPGTAKDKAAAMRISQQWYKSLLDKYLFDFHSLFEARYGNPW